MAQQLSFKPKAYDPLEDDRRKLRNAPDEHATALLNSYKLLQEANDCGLLDLLRGLIAAGDVAISKGATFANTPGGINTTRNLLAIGQTIGGINPDVLHRVVNDMTTSVAAEMALPIDRPPSLWRTMKRAFSPDALRGLSLAITLLASLGRTLRAQEKR